MIDIEISGGLGNQMFQYALYLKLKNMNKKLRLDTSFYKPADVGRELLLHIFEGVDYGDVCWRRNISLLQKISYKLKKREVYRDKIFTYQPEIYAYKDVILLGYWQNERFFSDISTEVRKVFTVRKELISRETRNIADEMLKCNSVSVHIRRGDYMSSQFSKVYVDLCALTYYHDAIEYMYKKLTDLCIYFFSDDMEWVKNNTHRFIPNSMLKSNIKYVDCNDSATSYMDMYLMSRCKHHIIANSTFSWWGAWLGDNEEKLVVAPSKWFNNNDKLDIVCDDWIKV